MMGVSVVATPAAVGNAVQHLSAGSVAQGSLRGGEQLRYLINVALVDVLAVSFVCRNAYGSCAVYVRPGMPDVGPDDYVWHSDTQGRVLLHAQDPRVMARAEQGVSTPLYIAVINTSSVAPARFQLGVKVRRRRKRRFRLMVSTKQVSVLATSHLQVCVCSPLVMPLFRTGCSSALERCQGAGACV